MTEILKNALKPYQEKAEQALKSHYSLFGAPSPLQEACVYALSRAGKRFRPALVWMVAEALKSPIDVTEAALAVEYFHTSSLIADDLPCMDDDDERRGSPSTHRVFGEAVALLASYSLIAEGYAALAKNAAHLKQAGIKSGEEILAQAILHASKTTGIDGASGGQFLDLQPPSEDYKTYEETVVKKTVSLFEISFILGWLFGLGDINKLDDVKKAAYHYGMAFQIADDFDDLKKDMSLGRKMNAALLLGKKEALQLFYMEIEKYKSGLKKLGIESAELLMLAEGITLPLTLQQHQE